MEYSVSPLRIICSPHILSENSSLYKYLSDSKFKSVNDVSGTDMIVSRESCRTIELSGSILSVTSRTETVSVCTLSKIALLLKESLGIIMVSDSAIVVSIKNKPCHVVYTDYRPTPLQHYIFPIGGDGIFLIVDEKGKFRENNFSRAIQKVMGDPMERHLRKIKKVK